MDFMCSHTKKVTNTGKRYFVGQHIYVLVVCDIDKVHYKIQFIFFYKHQN